MTALLAGSSELVWSPQQSAAIRSVLDWHSEPPESRSQVFRLFGWAGTGKTTLAKEIAANIKGLVLYATFTGKAALVLRKKGCGDASTIHSLIYKVEQAPRTGDLRFTLNEESDLRGAALLIVDEVSMVGLTLAQDLLSFGTPVLVLGDPFQLPPVKDEGFFTNEEPDVMLTEIHRQAEENPIIRLSMDVREGRRFMPGQYGESVVARSPDRQWLGERVLSCDQVLCGLNRTRVTYNRRIREMKNLRGFSEPWHPIMGDRLICLRNDREKAIFNGGMWDTQDVTFDGRGALDLTLTSLDEERPPITGRVFQEFFNGTEQTLDWKERRKSLEFTFGWAITCHKSQGSQWDDVLVFDESAAFREAAPNWLYTALTRAAEKVTVIL
jgi:exodeoxyribonuclease-5